MAQTSTSPKAPAGRHLLDDSDFVALVDGDDNEVGAVPKHWGPELIPAGLSKTKRKPTATRTTEASAQKIDEAVAAVKAEYEAKMAELQAQIDAGTGTGTGGTTKAPPAS